MNSGRIPQIGIVIGDDAGIAGAQEAFDLLLALRIPFVVTALAGTVPDDVRAYGQEIPRQGVEVIVVIGSASHIAGRLAAYTTHPVVVVPTAGAGETEHSREWGTMLSALETPPGVPLAVVGIDAVYNGIYLAVQILGVKDHRVRGRLAELRADQAACSAERTEAVEAYAHELQTEYPPSVDGERSEGVGEREVDEELVLLNGS